MYLIFFCAIIFVVLLSKFKTGTLLNLIVPFVVFWLLVLFASKYLSPDLYAVSDSTYNAVYIFVLIVAVTFLFFAKNGREYSANSHNLSFPSQRRMNNNILMFIVQIIVISILIYYLLKYNNLKAYLPAYKLRIVRYQIGELFGSGIEILFYNYVITTVVELFGLIAITKIIKTSKISFKEILSLISLFLYSLIGLGRFGLFNALFFILASFWFLATSEKSRRFVKKISFKNMLIVLTTVLLLISGMVSIGISRFESTSNDFSGFFESLLSSLSQALLYFTGPLRSLDYFFTFSSNTIVNYQFGQAFFSGINEFFTFLLSYVGINMTSSNSIISDLTNSTITIGNGVQFNAFYTAIFNAYLDGGYLGIFIFGAILGLITSSIWNLHVKVKNFYSYSLVVYFSLMLASTAYRFEFQQFKSFLIIGILIYCSIKTYRGEVSIDRDFSGNSL